MQSAHNNKKKAKNQLLVCDHNKELVTESVSTRHKQNVVLVLTKTAIYLSNIMHTVLTTHSP